MRLALALAVSAVVVAQVGEAQAKRIACSCPAEITLPAVRASDLPSNTQLWTLPAAADTAVRSMTMNPSPFTGAPDDTAPDAPHDVFVSVISSQFAAPAPIDAISMFGQYAPDTAIIHVEIRDRNGTHQLWTTPERRYLCFPGLALEPGRLDITIYALDLAGNASSPFHTTTETSFIAPADRDETCIEHREHHRGHGFEILGLLLLWLFFVVGWIAYLVGRRAVARRAPAEDVPVLAAEEVVRRLQRWQRVWTAMLAVAVLGLYAAHHDAELLAVMIAPFAIAAFCRLVLVHNASRLLHRPEASAVRHGRWLCVTTLHGSQLVRASDADFVAGKRASLPRSVAR